MSETEQIVILDPNALINQSLKGILDTMKYYVNTNPLKIKFSQSFLNAFESLSDIDKDLMGSKFEQILRSFKSSKDELKTLNMNLFRLQLRIIIKRKTIIEKECPDNPNIKSLVDIFNRKIEALLKIMEAQNEMEGDEKNPFDNAFVEFKSSKETLDNKLIELTETAKTSQRSLISHRTTLQKIESKLEFLQKRNEPLASTGIDELIKKWTAFTNPLYRGAIDVLKHYELHITESKKEEERFEKMKEEQEQVVENYKQNFVDQNLQKVKDFSKDVLKRYEDELENIKTKRESIQAQLKILYDVLEQGAALNKFKELQDSDHNTCEKQFVKYLDNKLNDFRNSLLTFNKVLSDEKRLESIIQLLTSEEDNITSHFNDVFLEKITNESQKKALNECISDIERLINTWKNDQTHPHFNKKVNDYLDFVKQFYENELQQITDLIDVPIKTGSNKIHPNKDSYICDLKYVMLQKSENEQKIESQNRMIDQFSGIYDEREKEKKEILEKLALFDDTSTTDLMNNVHRLVELKNEEEDLFKDYIHFNDTLIELEQEKEILVDSEEFLKKMEDKEEARFGDAVSFDELYDLYRHTYAIHYNPLVLKCHVLVIQGLMNEEIKSKMQKYVPLFYKPIDDLLYDDIKDTYDCTTDTKVFQLYENNINLTTSVSSIVLNDLMNERSEDTFTYLKYVHVGMCMLTVLKQYFKRAEMLPIPVFELFKTWIKNYSNEIDSEINDLYDEYIRDDERKCEFVLYEYCNTPFRDPMYRFMIKPSEYSDTYMNIQIDYYNTCEKIGYRNETYNRADAVRILDQKYYQIAEHYMLDNKISKVYLHKDSSLPSLDTDAYFNKKMVEPLIDPGTKNVTFLWKIMNIQTKSTRSNAEFLKKLVDRLIKIIENQQNHKETVLNDYFETAVTSLDKDTFSFSATFHWKNTTSVSVLYICDVTDAYKKNKTTFTKEEENSWKNEENDTVLRAIKNHTLKYYSGINQLMDPCWSMSSLVRFDLPKPRNEHTNFGVHCDLNSRKYDYERLCIVLDTTDNMPSDSFRCPVPYIDTSFLKVLNDLSIVTTLFQNEENTLYKKKIQFFTDICNDQVFEKMKRLLKETEHNDSTLTDVYNDTHGSLENIDRTIEKIETELNMKSALGLLFHVLGTTEDIIHFNNTTKHINSSRFEKSFLSLIRFFLNSM